MKTKKLCVIDTNVPKVANLALSDNKNKVPEDCILACVEAVESVTDNRNLVLDAGNEIFDEYRQQLSMKGQPGVGDAFMKWVHDTRWSLPEDQRVAITAKDESYEEFPRHDGLKNFDRSDKKFVAVSNAHPDKPAILQATDSKWWGWEKALKEVGIPVVFLCAEYIEKKYQKKIQDD